MGVNQYVEELRMRARAENGVNQYVEELRMGVRAENGGRS